MRVTVSHNKGKQEAMRIVDDAFDQVLRPVFSGPLRMTNAQKEWSGSRLNFSMNAGVSIVQVPIRGWILVTDTDITIDIDLPMFLEKLLPASARSSLQSAVRGLLK
jgi:Putative polyhydroxyalkanoic acid system protein (PHA_gran_rgn)